MSEVNFRDAVAILAYQKWLDEGCIHGKDQTHWFEAEEDIKKQVDFLCDQPQPFKMAAKKTSRKTTSK